MAIVSIFSGTYCHGEEISRLVAQRLDYESLEDKLLEETSRRFGIAEEKLRRTFTGPQPFWNNFTHEREKNAAAMKLVLAELLMEDGKLIHGYAGLMVPRNISHVLRSCVIANFAYRVEQAAKATGRSEKEATKLIHKDDQERLGWTRYLFDKTPYDESLYDLVVPTQDISVEQAVHLICEQACGEPVRTTPESVQASRDFLLAAKVNHALASANHDVDVTSQRNEISIAINQHVMRMKQYEEELRRIALAVPGVSAAKTRQGPRYRAPAINPMSNIDLPPKILLVDDEQEFVQTLSERLQKRDLTSSVVYNGEQALDYVERDQPDVMVLDLAMPGIGGIEVLRRLKQTHPGIEVIILTGHGSEQEEQLAAELGAFAYLQKPVNIEALAKVMRDAYRKVNEARASAPFARRGGSGEREGS